LSALLEVLKGTDQHLTDERGLVSEAARHGLAGLVQHELQRRNLALSPDAAQALRRQALFDAATSSKIRRLLFETLDAFDREGIPTILLKGYGLASRLYPDPLMRAMSDVDLLIPPDHLDRALHILRQQGLQPKVDADDYYPEQYRHAWALEGPQGLLELHFRPLTAFGVQWDSGELFTRSVSATLDGRPVRYLRPDDELVYLSLTPRTTCSSGWPGSTTSSS
jgi:hypothetical protein